MRGAFNHVGIPWKLLAFGSAVVACLSTGLADGDRKRPLACRQACRNAAYFGTVIAKLHTRGVFFVSVGDKMRTMPVTLFALGHALGTLDRAVRVDLCVLAVIVRAG